MSTIIYPCECEIQYAENAEKGDVVLNIKYCNKHQVFYNENLSLDENADNLSDLIFDEDVDRDIN